MFQCLQRIGDRCLQRGGRLSVLAAVFLLMMVPSALASGGDSDMMHRINLLVIQLGVIVLTAWGGGRLFERWQLPSVLGEIVAGMLIGPFCLGGLSFFGFPHGLFPVAGPDFPVTIELYAIATLASILLLFFIGLETDMEKFIQFSVPGFVIGFFGVAISFVLGDLVGMWYASSVLGESRGFFDPLSMFFGVISTATSVGISARILSDKHKMNSPEGVTILSAAVIDDILGLVILATVVGMTQADHVSLKSVAWTAGRSIGIWIVFTGLGLTFAHQISRVLKKSHDNISITLMSLALALILAGIFEKSGLAMIIGAYTMGLTLSKTDLTYMIQERMHVMQRFFVPIFFCVMGMMIDLKLLFSGPVLMFGGIYIVLAVVGKFIGCSVPALFCNFNRRGATLIGMGMVPRGEVALIVAGIGLSKGIIDDQSFSIAVIMTFFTTLMVPPILNKMFESNEPVLRKQLEPPGDTVKLHFDMPNPDTAEFIHRKVLDSFRSEGFHAYRQRHGVYFMRRNTVFITMTYSRRHMDFYCLKEDESFIYTMFYEVIAELERFRSTLKEFTDSPAIGRKMFAPKNGRVSSEKNLFGITYPGSVSTRLQGQTKVEVIDQLIRMAGRTYNLSQAVQEDIRANVLEREAAMSTAMQDGIALPHAKLECIDRSIVCVGVHHEGIDAQALDGQPSHIFVLLLIPKARQEDYLHRLSGISHFLSQPENRQKILKATSDAGLFEFLNQIE